MQQVVVFNLADQRYALLLSAVEKIYPIVQITTLPRAPECVMGIINVRGVIIPVIDIRRRFGLPAREIQLSDQLIVARTSRRTLALLVDSINDVAQHEQTDVSPAQEILTNLEYIDGVIKLNGDLVLVHDLDTFLSALEEETLDRAMTSGAVGSS